MPSMNFVARCSAHPIGHLPANRRGMEICISSRCPRTFFGEVGPDDALNCPNSPYCGRLYSQGIRLSTKPFVLLHDTYLPSTPLEKQFTRSEVYNSNTRHSKEGSALLLVLWYGMKMGKH